MITPRHSEDHSSFQSELAGIYGILLTLEALIQCSTNLHCWIACNGKSVLDRIQSSYPVLPTELHADLLQAIKTKVSQLGIQIDWRHVKGQQDSNIPMALPWDAWMNIEADLIVKEAVNLTYCGPEQYYLPGEGWICQIGTRCIIKQLLEKLCVHINGAPAA